MSSSGVASLAGPLLAGLQDVIDVLGAVPAGVSLYAGLSDDELVEATRLSSDLAELVGSRVALAAGEVAHRSSRDLGHAGLAARAGFRSPEEFLKAITRTTGRDAAKAVKVGRLMRQAATDGQPDPATGIVTVADRPWLAAVAAAVTAGTLSVAAADAIRAGLGETTDQIGADLLGTAVPGLIADAAALDPDALYRAARTARDLIDEAGIVDRERALHEARTLTLTDTKDGGARLVWQMDPETAISIRTLYHRTVSPKRGGVRFADPDRQAHSDRIKDDPRTAEQLASDVFLQLLRAGADADSSQLLGSGAPQIRVLVTRETLADARQTAAAEAEGEGGGGGGGLDALTPPAGHGYFEGSGLPISMATIDRLACTGTTTPLGFDTTGQSTDVGREQRLFTARQRIALTARDGGCMWPTCTEPANRTEAHHIRPWKAEHGRTDTADGILLCTFHHLTLHNNNWRIERTRADYTLIPPPHIDPTRTPIPMPTKSSAMKELRHKLDQQQCRAI